MQCLYVLKYTSSLINFPHQVVNSSDGASLELHKLTAIDTESLQSVRRCFRETLSNTTAKKALERLHKAQNKTLQMS